ncbi:MAG: HU family DNA-binding protein [Tannerellaceae bacterium]|nr:HU family DNA-binding protein [Tannerellaceae bacterium]MCD8265034.1 HU family DNA-binding protein [Tannerellaceae bacterium]
MAAKYQLFRNPRSLLKENREELLYPRIVRNRIIRLEEIANRISASSSFTPGDVLGVWEALKGEILNALEEGNRVELEGLGGFYPVLKCRDVTDPKEIRAESIRFSKVAFSPAPVLHRKLSTMQLERAEGYPKRQELTPSRTAAGTDPGIPASS